MAGAQDGGGIGVAEHMARDQRRQRLIQMIHVGQPAAEHDGIGIDQIDHRRQRPRQPVRMAIQRGLGPRIAGSGPRRQARGIARAGAIRIRRQRRAAEEGLDAAGLPAPAGGAGMFVRAHPGQRVVAPFAPHPVPPFRQPSIHHQPAADAGAEDGGEDRAIPGAGPVRRLAHRQAIGVIGQPHGAREPRLQIRAEGLAVELGGIGAPDQPRDGVLAAGDADAQAAARAELGLRALHQPGDGGDGADIVARSGDAPAQPHGARAVQRHDLDLGPAEIHPEPPAGWGSILVCHAAKVARRAVSPQAPGPSGRLPQGAHGAGFPG